MPKKRNTTENPIFVLCYSRSGSTLLRYILDTHPKVVCPPELHLAITAARLLELTATALYSDSMDDRDERRQAALPRVRKIVSAIMDETCDNLGKPVWCEKSVSTIDFPGLIHALYPHARFICLHRHALDFRVSALEALKIDASGGSFGFDRYLSAAAGDRKAAVVDYWCDKTQAILQFESTHPDQCFRIRYEDLVADPGGVTSELFAFLGLDCEDDLVDRVFNTSHSPGPGDWKIRRTSEIATTSVGRFNATTIQEIDTTQAQRIDALHEKLNYERLANAG